MQTYNGYKSNKLLLYSVVNVGNLQYY